MFKNFWFWIIAWMVICILLSTFTGCRNSSSNLDLPVPLTPAEQLLDAAKQASWLVTVSIVGIAISIFATLNGQKWGIAGVISCCVSLFMTLAVSRFAFWMAFTGLLGSMGLCVASILIRKKALVEIIRGVENYRDVKIEHDMVDGCLDVVQSESTKKIVSEIKAKI
ncbi:unnamed protein product [marine sediment metagenome]|uniref:Uncharacterized protein n=1 Tax=marine sediment metagenome TaxID=412755 RepID=X1SJN7_9ZZZZ